MPTRENFTTIPVSRETRAKLVKLKADKNQSYETVITNLMKKAGVKI